MGCLKYPKKEMYRTHRYRVNIFANTMTKTDFFPKATYSFDK